MDVFGYIGLALGLLAIAKKQMFAFRLWHIASSTSYIIYGILLSAYPIIVSGLLFICIHLYNLNKSINQEKAAKNEH